MLEINDALHIPEGELEWTFTRSGGPGGQNVNKVSSRAVLRWRLGENTTLPDEVKTRLRTLQRRRITTEGDLLVSSQQHRDQLSNRQTCLERLRDMVLEALERPTPRRATRPTRGSQRRRLQDKRRRSETKQRRRESGEDG